MSATQHTPKVMTLHATAPMVHDPEDAKRLWALHAAAPDTTAALRGLVDAINGVMLTICPFCAQHRTKHDARCPLAVAVAAIAKAEGKDAARTFPAPP